MDYIAVFFAGAFLCNSLPHVTSGVSGAAFPTPFAKPSGIGNSSPLVNVLWGAANFFVGLYLLQRHPVSVGSTSISWCYWQGCWRWVRSHRCTSRGFVGWRVLSKDSPASAAPAATA
jgi:hypothetical protein